MNVDEALAISDEPQNYTHLEQAAARNTLAAEVRRLRALHSPETAEVEDVNGISEVTYCGHDGHPWPCPSLGGAEVGS